MFGSWKLAARAAIIRARRGEQDTDSVCPPGLEKKHFVIFCKEE